MIFYPPTLLPPSPPYRSFDDIITSLCDKCLVIGDDTSLSAKEIDQYFELTMAIIDFWYTEIEGVSFK